MNKALTTSKNVAQWLWRSAGAAIVLVLLIAVFIIGYSLGVGPGEPADAPAEPAAHDHADEKVQWTCAMHPQIRKPTPGKCPICAMDLIPASGGAGDGMRRLTITPQAERLLDIQTTPVQRRFVQAEVSMVGKIDYDETRLGDITAYVGGRLDRLFVDYTGVTVKKGDHMVELYSPELLAAQEELLQAIQAVQSLRQSNVDIVRQTAQQTVDAVREKLRLWGLTKQQIDAIEQRGKPEETVVINSPLSGIVIHKNAQEGMYVQTGTRIYTIADLSQLWVKFDAYESDLIWLRYGQPVQFTTEAYPGEVFHGQIAFIDPVLDDVRRTVKVRVNVPNEDGRLKPGMFARGLVKARVASRGRVVDESLAGKWISPMHPEIIKDKPGLCDVCGMPLVRVEELGYVSPSEQPASKPLVVPASAVLTTGKRAIVYVKVPGSEQPTFEGRQIVLGPRAGDHYIVYSNLREGEQVVTHGSFKLDSELQLRAKPSMMTPDGGSFTGGHDHGGHAGQPAAGGAEAPMTLPDMAAAQWRGVERAAARLRQAADGGDMERVQQRARQVLLAMRDVDAGKLSGPAAGAWTEMSMRLTNDVVEALHARNVSETEQPLDALAADMTQVRQQFGLQPPKSEPADVRVTAAFGEALGGVLEVYFALADALTAGDVAAADAAGSTMRDAISAADGAASDGAEQAFWQRMRQRLAQAIAELREAPELAGKRAAFSPLSTTLAEVVAAADDQIAMPVYEVKCPMAFNNAGATWLQRDRKVTNPYYGDRMLRCGDVIGTLAFDRDLMQHAVLAAPALAEPDGGEAATRSSAASYEVDQLDGLVTVYLDVSAALTAGDLPQAKAKLAALREALSSAEAVGPEGQTPQAWERSARNLASAVDMMGEAGGIEQARQGFALLSEELAGVLRAAAGAGAPVYLARCPMAFDNRGATWVQSSKQITNPYFGDRMLRCGSIVETITPNRAAPRKENGND